MHIGNMKIQEHDEQSFSVTATIEGKDIYYHYGGIKKPGSVTGDAFLAIAIIPAMAQASDIYLDDSVPVTQHFVDNLATYQKIYQQWYPDLKAVEIHSTNILSNPEKGKETGCFFSGGVDSFYSFTEHAKQIDHLILCRGLDIPHSEEERWQKTVKRIREFAQLVGTNIITVSTNAKENYQLKRNDNHGSILISNALPLHLETAIIPSSHSCNGLFPCGSHPISDPLLSTGVTRVLHDFPETRLKKTEAILKYGKGTNHLRVCNRQAMYNCGACEKCLRTMVALDILGKRIDSLPEKVDYRSISKLRIDAQNQYDFWVENYLLAQKKTRPDAERAIKRVIDRYEKREFLKKLDALYLGSMVTRIKRAVFARKRVSS